MDWWDSSCRLWFFDKQLPGYTWYVPKNGGYLNIGVGGNTAVLKERGSSIQEHWDYLINKLTRLGLIEDDPPDPAGYVYYLNSKGGLPPQEKVYLVGDAVGLATLDMGEGIGPAIRSGQLAAEEILGNDKTGLSKIPRYSLLPPGLRWLVAN
jgi:flavin-dependent dehydrogenase